MITSAVDTLPDHLFQIIFEKSPGSIVVKADLPKFTIVAASDSYLKVTSTIRDNIIGKGFFDVFPDIDQPENDDTAARKVFTRVITTGEKLDIPVYRYDIYDAEAGRREESYWSCSNVPILGNDKKIAYILNTVINITEEVKAKQAALESESRLLLATEATGLAIWDLDLNTDAFNYSPQLLKIFGYHDEDVSLAGFRNQVYHDDMEKIIKGAFLEALQTGTYFYEVRIAWPDGSQHWIRTQGKIIFDDNERPLRMIGTMVDVTESKRDEIRKNDFIAMASHELKTPLTSLKAYVQVLTEKLKNFPDPFINQTLEKAGNQVNKMSVLIHGFLDLSKLEPGKLQLSMQTFDIAKLIQDTIAESKLLSSSHTIHYTPISGINVYADRDKISQVLANYLSNAIKYSSKGSAITVTSELVDDSVKISVIDNGIGIKPKDQEKLFQRFYRVENEKSKNISGFGIGLYLSSEIIQRHKGKIGVSSDEGTGSTFYFSLPLSLKPITS